MAYVLPGDLPFGDWDGHTHTGFCPHGSGEPTAAFVERAADLAFARWSLTEHAPFPPGFRDPSPRPTSALPPSDLPRYLDQAEALRAQSADRIEVLVGLEVDYFQGLESETRALLDTVGPRIQDALLSVHFVPDPRAADRWLCVDWSPADLRARTLFAFGSVEAFHAAYWQQVLSAVRADLGPYAPRRLAHLTLAHKFRRVVGEPDEAWTLEHAEPVLHEVAQRGLALDLDVARWSHPETGLPAPIPALVRRARALGIPLVYGSDAHAVRAVGRQRAEACALMAEPLGNGLESATLAP